MKDMSNVDLITMGRASSDECTNELARRLDDADKMFEGGLALFLKETLNTNKYELTNETKTVNGVTVHRIKHLKTGELGGWVQSVNNLAQEGDCWVSGEAVVMGEARVKDNAIVTGKAKVMGSAVVSGNDTVVGESIVIGNNIVTGALILAEGQHQ